MISIASHMDAHRPERVPAFMPARLPAWLRSWQGDPPSRMSTFGTVAQSTLVTSPRLGTSGWWCARILDGAASYSANQDVSPPRTDRRPIPSPS
jgi:hypothetical protein